MAAIPAYGTFSNRVDHLLSMVEEFHLSGMLLENSVAIEAAFARLCGALLSERGSARQEGDGLITALRDRIDSLIILATNPPAPERPAAPPAGQRETGPALIGVCAGIERDLDSPTADLDAITFALVDLEDRVAHLEDRDQVAELTIQIQALHVKIGRLRAQALQPQVAPPQPPVAQPQAHGAEELPPPYEPLPVQIETPPPAYAEAAPLPLHVQAPQDVRRALDMRREAAAEDVAGPAGAVVPLWIEQAVQEQIRNGIVGLAGVLADTATPPSVRINITNWMRQLANSGRDDREAGEALLQEYLSAVRARPGGNLTPEEDIQIRDIVARFRLESLTRVLCQPEFLALLDAREGGNFAVVAIMIQDGVAANTIHLAQITDHLFIGSEFAAASLINSPHVFNWYVLNMAGDWRARLQAGLSLAEASANFFPDSRIEYSPYIGTTDEANADIPLDLLADEIDAQIQAGKDVFVHCKQGKSRSGAAVIAYLIKYRGMTFEQARELFVVQRGLSRENLDQHLPNRFFIARLREFARVYHPAAAEAARGGAQQEYRAVCDEPIPVLLQRMGVNRNGGIFVNYVRKTISLGDSDLRPCNGREALNRIRLTRAQVEALERELRQAGAPEDQIVKAISVFRLGGEPPLQARVAQPLDDDAPAAAPAARPPLVAPPVVAAPARRPWWETAAIDEPERPRAAAPVAAPPAPAIAPVVASSTIDVGYGRTLYMRGEEGVIPGMSWNTEVPMTYEDGGWVLRANVTRPFEYKFGTRAGNGFYWEDYNGNRRYPG